MQTIRADQLGQTHTVGNQIRLRQIAVGVLHGAVDQVQQQVVGNIVEHQGRNDLVGIETGFQPTGQTRPQTACHHRGSKSDHHAQGNGYGQIERHHHGADGAHDKLTLRADIPKLRTESNRNTQRHDQGGSELNKQLRNLLRAAESTAQHGAVSLAGLIVGEDDQNGADEQRHNHH